MLSFCFVDITLISNHLLSLHAGAPAAALKNIPTVPISALADAILPALSRLRTATFASPLFPMSREGQMEDGGVGRTCSCGRQRRVPN